MSNFERLRARRQEIAEQERILDQVDKKRQLDSVNPPVPVFIKVFGVIIFVMIIISSYKIPEKFNAKITFEKGKVFETKNEYVKAIDCYNEVLIKYPKSTALLTRLLISHYNLKNYSDVISILKMLLEDEEALSYSDKKEIYPILEELNFSNTNKDKVEVK